jgi:cation-transporting P-type ATPase C
MNMNNSAAIEHEHFLSIDKSERAKMLLQDYTIASMTTGLVPVPIVDVAVLSGIQFKMIHSIGKVYEKKLTPNRIKAVVTSLIGGALPVTGLSAASLTKFVPGFGTAAGTVGMVTMGGTSTYALGRVLIQHFESGGDLDQLSPKSARASFVKELKAGKRFVEKLKGKGKDPGTAAHFHDHSHAWGPDHEHGHDHSHACKPDHEHGSGKGDHQSHPHAREDRGEGSCVHVHAHQDQSQSACGDDACGHDHATDDTTIAKYKHKIYVGGGTLLVLGAQRVLLPSLVVGAVPVYIIAGTATLITGFGYISGVWHSLVKRKINTDTLVGTATVASLALGNAVTALAVLFLLNIGTYFEAITLRKTNRAIRDLLEIDENEEVWLVARTENGEEVETRRRLATVKVGDRLAVYAGQKVPADGYVVQGDAQVNQAPITGEERPVGLKEGDAVYAGFILLAGKLTIEVEKLGRDTVVGRIIERVHKAEELRPPIQTVGEEFSKRFVPFSFAMAGGVLLLTLDPTRALTMLLIACPCAVGLSTPTSVSASIGNSAKRGILVRGGAHLEAAAQANVVVVDKTGTLTNGVPSVARIIACHDEFDERGLLAMAASAELHSNHPLGAAVISHAKEEGVEIVSPESYKSIDGSGMRASWNGGSVFVGNHRLMEHFGIEVCGRARANYERYTEQGETVLFVSYEKRCVGVIGIRNNIRPYVAETLEHLPQRGVSRVIMLTGDQQEAARLAANSAGIGEWHAGLMPEDKYRFVRELQAEGHKVIMVGDGINDAPALAIADVGIAIGTGGSDVAIESSDIALSSDDFRKLDETLQISNKTIATIRQNYGMALVINAGGLVVAAMGMINPFAAVVLHNFSTAAVLINSSRLVGYKPNALNGKKNGLNAIKDELNAKKDRLNAKKSGSNGEQESNETQVQAA